MTEMTKKYSNGEITVVWKPDTCIHSGICWKGAAGLTDVFDPRKKPWINPQGAASERIIQQINQCPSGALSYFRNAEGEELKIEAAAASILHAEIKPNGSIRLHGEVTITHKDGRQEVKPNGVSLCRCGASENKPFCDGSHKRIGFQDA